LLIQYSVSTLFRLRRLQHYLKSSCLLDFVTVEALTAILTSYSKHH